MQEGKKSSEGNLTVINFDLSSVREETRRTSERGSLIKEELAQVQWMPLKMDFGQRLVKASAHLARENEEDARCWVDEERRLHTVAVLEEQRVQRQQGIRDPEKLSKVSRLSSFWSRERARKLATSPSDRRSSTRSERRPTPSSNMAEGPNNNFFGTAAAAANNESDSGGFLFGSKREFNLLLVGGVRKAAFVESHQTGNERNASRVDDCTALVFPSNRGPIQFNVRSVNGRELVMGTALQCECAIIVFDLTNQITYTQATNWHRDITRACGNIPIVLVGSNAGSKDRKVKSKQIEAFVWKKNIPYFDTSVKLDYNLEAPFLWLARTMKGDPLLHFVRFGNYGAHSAASSDTDYETAHSVASSDSDLSRNDNGGREFSGETMDESNVPKAPASDDDNDPANRLSLVAEAAKLWAAKQKPLSSSQTYEMSGSDSESNSDEVVDVEKAAFIKRVNERNAWRVDRCLDQRSRGRRAVHEQARAASSQEVNGISDNCDLDRKRTCTGSSLSEEEEEEEEEEKSPAAKQKPLSPMQTYEMSDREANNDSEESDSDEEENPRPKKTIPEWAQKANLHRALERQSAAGPDRLDPDKIFGEVLTCDLEEIFGKKTSKYRKRTSSGNWSKDGVLPAEKVIYKRHMAAALAMPPLPEEDQDL